MLAKPADRHFSSTQQHMGTRQPLSCEATILADDSAWSKLSCIPGQPEPIPPRNEPLLYSPSINNNLHTTPVYMRTRQPLSCEATILADDSACQWSKPSRIPGQSEPIPPRNEPLLYSPSINDNPHTTPVDERELGSHLASAAQISAQSGCDDPRCANIKEPVGAGSEGHAHILS